MVLKIFLIAGEASGDVLGGRLMESLAVEATQNGYSIEFTGIGGEHMLAAGLQKSRFPMRELSLIGIAEILPHLPRLLRRIHETIHAIKTEKPDILITIDAPAFGLRVAGRLGAQPDTLRVHYVAPQHWAWRPGRAKALNHETDLLLALLPFEPAFFAQYQIQSHYVGHPVIEAWQNGNGDQARFRAAHHIANDSKIILLLPGSRRSEFIRLMPQFIATLKLILGKINDITLPTVVLPLAAASQTLYENDPQWQNLIAQLPCRVITIPHHDDQAKWDSFAAAASNGLALAASGTVTLELALAGIPTIVAYRLSWFSFILVKLLVRVKHVALANIIGGERIMPEFLQSHCRPDILADAMLDIINDAKIRQNQINGLQQVARALVGDENDLPPSRRAARAIMKFWQKTA